MGIPVLLCCTWKMKFLHEAQPYILNSIRYTEPSSKNFRSYYFSHDIFTLNIHHSAIAARHQPIWFLSGRHSNRLQQKKKKNAQDFSAPIGELSRDILKAVTIIATALNEEKKVKNS